MTAATPPESSRVRLTILAVVVVCLFASLFARLWYLQVISGPQAQAAAQSQGVRIVYTPAPRGRILDRNGTPIVDNRISEVVTVSRDIAKREPDVLGRLAALLGVSFDSLQHTVNDPRYSPYAPVPVAQDVDVSKIVYIKEHTDEFPGVDAEAEAVRSYMPGPLGMVAANIVGYVGQITDKQLAEYKKDGYQPGDQFGQTGIEAGYESVLRGQPGITKVQVDSQGRVLGILGYQPPVQGHDVWLSIDLNDQKLAEDSLAQGLAADRQNNDKSAGGPGNSYKAPAGAVSIIDPRDGSVLALATNPTYNPADFVNGISTPRFAYYQDPNNHFPLDDRTIQGQYAPGSTFKLVTAIAGLQSGIINPGATFDDKGFLQVGPTKFYNDNHQAYGPVNLSRALTVSSDSYFYNVGATFWDGRARYGDDALQNVARELGFGSPTGIALPNEASGRIPDPASRKKLHAENPQAFPTADWFTGDSVNTAIGQGDVAVTPLQLANAYATFANGGTLWQPRIALKVTDQAGKVLQSIDPVQVRHVDLPPQWRAPMLAGFEGVVGDPAGTAHAAFSGFPLAQFPIAGKTGTAQVAGKQPTSVFTSFAPATNPQFVVDAFLEQAGYGADAAAPVVRRIYDGLFNQPLQPVTMPKTGVD
jgi:penicillin-binding protein 2